MDDFSPVIDDLTRLVLDSVCAQDPLLTVQDICTILHNSESTVYNWLGSGLACERVGTGIRRVRLSELDRFMKEKNIA